ncbi:hypothetical protein QJQ45_025259 [Haematococcus lacustris]|nr:hypothetical protein QJQ45_025259 [Haematococcus lacustris]
MLSQQSMKLRCACGPKPAQHAERTRKPMCIQATAVAVTTDGGQGSLGPQTYTRMRLKTKADCRLGVSIYPEFAYNAVGGGGWARVEAQGGSLLHVTFDPQVLSPAPVQPSPANPELLPQAVIIPDLSWRTASLFKVPIPPPLNIAITPLKLQGTVDLATGQMELQFDANFVFSAGPLYTAPPLVVRTLLTTEDTQGSFRKATGQRIVGSIVKWVAAGYVVHGGRVGFGGHVGLVGTATVDKTGDLFLDNFLLLPTDALAIMSAELEFA